MEVHHDQIIQHEINGIIFDVYTKDYVRKNSIKQITDPIAFDTLNCPNIGGLCDPNLGVSAHDKTSPCITCGHNTNNCTGHFGHIELAVVLYNPLMMKIIHRLLKAKCFNCNKIKLKEKEKCFYFLKLLLIKMGYIREASDLESIISFYNYDPSVIDLKINELLKQKRLDYLENFNVKFDENKIHIDLVDRDNTTGDEDTNEFDSVEKKKKKKNKSQIENNTSIDKEELKIQYIKERKAEGEKIKMGKLKKLEEIINLINLPYNNPVKSLDIELFLK